ncbi:hypothetical protein [Aquimarina algicola]|uniref:Uncharacterized protein n=1 Tax=Aquimarina algicola TaxID=2589995 RepID=A0A504J3C7_9FLAO|nr:hypothetical protein [Aquimarina algicola]TPN82932.1 hypothetical protein FHK87_21130 [Aquimarina algicola]
MTAQNDKEKRIKAFLKDLKKISVAHGVVIETNRPPYALNIKQDVTYLINPKTKSIFPVWLNDEEDPLL